MNRVASRGAIAILLALLLVAGLGFFVAEYVTNAFSKEIKENFKDDAEPRPVCIAGRIMSWRNMGIRSKRMRLRRASRSRLVLSVT